MKILLRSSVAILLVFTMIFTLGVSAFTEGIFIADPVEIVNSEDETGPVDLNGSENNDTGDEGHTGGADDVEDIGTPGEAHDLEVPSEQEGQESTNTPKNPEEQNAPEDPNTPKNPEEQNAPEDPNTPENPEEQNAPEDPENPEEPKDGTSPGGGATNPVIQNPSFALIAEPDQYLYIEGDTLIYNIIIINTGNVDLEALILQDSLNGTEVIDFLSVGDQIVLQKEYFIPDEYLEPELSNTVLVTGGYLEFELFQEADFTVYVEYLEDMGFEEEGSEYFPSVIEPEITLPEYFFKNRMMSLMSSSLEDTIATKKEALRAIGCRTYEITLTITGTPQEVPVDVVLVIDRSGSMNDSAGGNAYYPIAGTPANNGSYYVKIGNNYESITWHQNNIWRYGNNQNRRYVKWDFNGDDNAAGSINQNNATPKPFYIRGNSRLHFAKEAAINFAAKVLGPDGVPGSRVSVVSYSGPSTTSGNGYQNQASTDIDLTSNLFQVVNAINSISAGGGTNTEAGFIQGRSAIENSGNPSSNKVVLMLTDGLPTASNGNRYAETTDQTHIHVTSAIAAGQAIYQDQIADVFTIGLLQNMTSNERSLAQYILNAAQNRGFYEAPSSQDLDSIFDAISQQLGYAATNAVVVDKIGDNFNLVESTLPAGATYNPTSREITWTPGTIVDKAELKYIVQAKSEFIGGLAYTNEYAKLTYTDILGTDGVDKVFDKPQVDVPFKLAVTLTDTVIALGESTSLGTFIGAITGGDGNGTYTYEWRIKGESQIISTQRNPLVSPIEDTEYELTVIDSNGCKAIATMWVRIQKGSITITKIINDFKVEDANKTFDIFVRDTNNKVWTVSLKHNQSKTITGLAIGTYSISEVVPMNFELVNITNQTIVITEQNLSQSATVYNIRDNDGWFYDDDERVNTFSGIVVVITQTVLPEPIILKEELDLEGDF